MGRKAVPQQVRVHLARIKTGELRALLHDLPNAGRGELASIAIEKDEALRPRLHQLRAGRFQPAPERVTSCAADGHEASLVSFAGDTDPSLVQVQVLQARS